jgi:glycine cleavage system transcriptional repressor
MENWYMVTVVCKDRIGVVAALTDALYQGGANLGEASMMRLGGTFTMMIMVQTERPTASVEQWIEPVARAMDLRIHVDPIDAKSHAHIEPNARVTVYGSDRPGIVAQVTKVLAAEGFNILNLNSEVARSESKPVYLMLLEGYTATAIDKLDRALSPLRAGGIELRVVPIDIMVG